MKPALRDVMVNGIVAGYEILRFALLSICVHLVMKAQDAHLVSNVQRVVSCEPSHISAQNIHATLELHIHV